MFFQHRDPAPRVRPSRPAAWILAVSLAAAAACTTGVTLRRDAEPDVSPSHSAAETARPETGAASSGSEARVVSGSREEPVGLDARRGVPEGYSIARPSADRPYPANLLFTGATLGWATPCG